MRHRTLPKIWVGAFLVRNVPPYSPGKDFELILIVKMELDIPYIEGRFGIEFPAICNHCVVMAAWSRKTRKFCEHCLRFLKTTSYGKMFKSLFRKFTQWHRLMLLCWNFVKFVWREIGEIVRYLHDKKHTNKISPASQTVADATVWIAPKICQSQPPPICSHYSRFHPNRFTFGWVIAERVNTVFPVEYFHNSLVAMFRFGWS